MELNHYQLDPAAMHQCRLQFDFDLFGSALHSLAPHFPTSLSYRDRRLAECPPAPQLSVAAPPWNRLLALLSALVAGRVKVRGKVLLVAPHWPAQAWWPLLERLSQGRLLQFKGNPWVSPAGKRAPDGAVAIWVGA